jgi:glycosyltransferase involved in cell wall biosynthesis
VPRADRARVASVYRNAARVMAVSEALKASVDCVARKEVAEVVPNTVDSDHFELPPAPRCRRPFVFLAVGDLVPSKRFDLLVRAFARVHAADNATRLVIAGEGRERNRLRELAFALKVGEAIDLTGPLGRDDVRRRMWEANALVMPSAFETFGVVLIEALSTGLPVIATRCGGPEEIVTPDLGLLIDCDGERPLLESMTAIIDRDFRPTALRETVAQRFGYAEVAQRICEVYETVAGQRREVA